MLSAVANHHPEMLSAVANHRPEMLSAVAWLYGAHLLVEGAPAGAVPVSSQRGVRQGDPLGPFLFGLTLQSALKQVDAAAPEGQVIALYGPTDVLIAMAGYCRRAPQHSGDTWPLEGTSQVCGLRARVLDTYSCGQRPQLSRGP
jgi:hypothetical protein